MLTLSEPVQSDQKQLGCQLSSHRIYILTRVVPHYQSSVLGAEKHDVFSLTIERKPISGRTVFLTQPEQQPELKLSSNRRNSRTNKSKNKKADLVFHYFFKYCSPTQCNHAQNTTLASLCTPPRILYAGNLRISYAERRKIFALYHSLIS